MTFRKQLNFLSKLTMRRTKIIATLGPSTEDPATIEALLSAGVDVFRMNFSHGTHETHIASFAAVKEAIKKSGRHVAILGDLCGPKIRVGIFPDGPIQLIEGKTVTITVRDVPGTATLIPTEYAHLHRDVKAGDTILLADGVRELRVRSVKDTEIECLVIRGGSLSNRKGLNLPNVNISSPSFTEKDRKDAELAIRLGVDYLALSFVRQAAEIHELRDFLRERNADIPIMSKIEKPEALGNIDDIVEASDAIMIARGDLGVEMPCEEIPLIQKELTRLCILANKPVVVATQMLESMISSGTPTRAEVTDVAWAAMAGADAVMLSGETSIGKYPIQAVENMDRIVRIVEGYQSKSDRFTSLVSHDKTSDHESAMDSQIFEGLSRSAATMSRELNAKAIAVCAKTGTTCRMIAQERPHSPILGLSTDPRICARMNLYWGVLPILVHEDVIRSPWVYISKILEDTGLYTSRRTQQYVILVTLRGFDMALTPSLKIIVD